MTGEQTERRCVRAGPLSCVATWVDTLSVDRIERRAGRRLCLRPPTADRASPPPGRGDSGCGRRRLVARAMVIMTLVTGGTLGLTVPAAAHHALTASDPADGATVNDPPAAVSLTFDQPVEDSDVFRAMVVVTGPDDQQYQDGTPTTNGDVITAAVAPLTAAGQYAVAYRVISDQGVVGGSVHFTLLHPAARSDTTSPHPRVTLPPADSAAAADADPTSGGLPWWIWATLATVVVGAGIMIIRDMLNDPPRSWP